MKHSHHVIPVHKGGEDGPTVEMNPWDHAELHAERFLDGRDDGFHMGLLEFLSPDLQLLVRKRQSEITTGERNPNFGKSPTKGMNRFTNGVVDTISFECPPGWREGSWTKGVVCPQRGTPGIRWWNNGEEEVQTYTQPNGFVSGRLPRKGRTWKPLTLFDTTTKETIEFESQKLCCEFLNVSPKVVRRRLENGKLIHNRFLVSEGKISLEVNSYYEEQS
jgi:hypothetical protein